MTQYTLKKDVESFDVVDGAFAGRKFVRGKAYGEVPPEEKGKFEEIGLRPIGAYTPVGSQKSEVRDQKSEVPGNMGTVRNRKSEVRSQPATNTADKKSKRNVP